MLKLCFAFVSADRLHSGNYAKVVFLASYEKLMDDPSMFTLMWLSSLGMKVGFQAINLLSGHCVGAVR